jgi:hypothetical protein
LLAYALLTVPVFLVWSAYHYARVAPAADAKPA